MVVGVTLVTLRGGFMVGTCRRPFIHRGARVQGDSAQLSGYAQRVDLYNLGLNGSSVLLKSTIVCILTVPVPNLDSEGGQR